MVRVSKRGRAVALLTAVVTLTVLVTAVIAAWPRLEEEWYLRDLATYDEERSKNAAEWFSQDGSVRAMQRLFDLSRELALRPDAEDTSKATCNSIARVCQALEAIALRRRCAVVPLLVTILREKPPQPIPGNELRIGAANFLAKIGLDARDAIPALQGELNDEEERFRKCVAEALKKIQGLPHETPR